MGFDWTGTTTFHLRAHDDPPDDDLEPEVQQILDAPMISTQQPPLPPLNTSTTPTIIEPAPTTDTTTAPAPDIPPDLLPTEDQLQHIEPSFRPQAGEDFKAKRARIDRQETFSYKTTNFIEYHLYVWTSTTARTFTTNTYTTSSPYYSNPKYEAALSHEIEIDVTGESPHLPPGWHFEHGYIVMNDIHDEWQIKGNYLIRHHYVPRNSTFDPSEEECPVPLEHLGKTRSTYFGDTSYHDRWHVKNKTFSTMWTGSTRFKILPTYRKMCHDVFYNVSDGCSTYAETKAKDKNNLDERKMSLADRLAFTEAKRKELTSIFRT